MSDPDQPQKIDRYNTRYLVADMKSDRRKSVFMLLGVVVALAGLVGLLFYLQGGDETDKKPKIIGAPAAVATPASNTDAPPKAKAPKADEAAKEKEAPKKPAKKKRKRKKRR